MTTMKPLGNDAVSLTVKYPGESPAEDGLNRDVYIKEFIRSAPHSPPTVWAIGQYDPQTSVSVRVWIIEARDALFPNSSFSGSRPLTESDVAQIKDVIDRRLGRPSVPVSSAPTPMAKARRNSSRRRTAVASQM